MMTRVDAKRGGGKRRGVALIWGKNGVKNYKKKRNWNEDFVLSFFLKKKS